MIQKSDALILLLEMRDKGEDVSSDIDGLYRSKTIPLSTLKKINSHRTLDLTNFYEKIRKSYNHKSSKLYSNIMKADENALKDPKIAVTTLTALLNQIYRFNVEEYPTFYKSARVGEILEALNYYNNNYDLSRIYNILHLIKADIIVMEFINNHRNID